MAQKSDLAYEYLKTGIINGDFAPLTSISEKDIQEKLQTSRTPVREALLRLQELGFIYIYPNRGTIVSELSLELIEEMYDTRLLNEAKAYIEASKVIKPNLLETFKARFLKHSKDDSGQYRLYYISLDDELHDTLLSYTRNRFIKRSLQMVYDHNRRLRRFVTEPISIPEHLELIDAMLSKKEERITKAVTAHLDGSREHTLNALRKGEFKANLNR